MQKNSLPSLPPSISVIIPVYRGGDDFQECLNALAASNSKPKEIIIVADGGMHGTPQPDESLGAILLETAKAGGPARARNLGAEKASGDILFFFDADVTIGPDTIAKVTAEFAKSSKLAALFGSYDDAPGKRNFLSQYRNLLHHYVHQIGKEDASTFWSGCGAIRREVFFEFGGFDATLFDKPAIEDIELGYRIKKAGHKIKLCKDIQIKHLKHWGPWSIVKTDFFQRALPWTELILRDKNFLNDLNTDTASRLSVVAIFLLVLSLAAAILWPPALVVSAAAGLLLTILNRNVYQFFRKKRGGWFTLRVIPWHWLYYFYSGLAFGIGYLKFSFFYDEK